MFLLLMIQLCLNNKWSEITKESLFFINFIKLLNLFSKELSTVLMNLIIKKINILKNIHDNITNMQKTTLIKINVKRKMTSQLKKKNKVYLLIRNLKLLKERSKKLNHIKIKSFFITVQKRFMNFKLNLLQNAKIHKMFHISLLKLIDSDIFIQKTFYYQ